MEKIFPPRHLAVVYKTKVTGMVDWLDLAQEFEEREKHSWKPEIKLIGFDSTTG